MSHQERLKLEYSLKLYSEALRRFEEALMQTPENENSLVIDGSIQRFEFCYEMSWKTLKRFLDFHGQAAKTPRDAFKAAFKIGWIQSDDVWMAMINDRNQTSHTYNRKIAQQVYSNLSGHLNALKALESKLNDVLAHALKNSSSSV